MKVESWGKTMAYEIEEAKKLVIQAGLELVKEGYITRTWGNISARISNTEFVITPSGRTYESLTPADIVTVKIADLSYTGDIKPSSEKGVHAAIYKRHSKANFVIHTHQDYATDLSSLALPVEVGLIDPELALITGDVVPCASYGMNATSRLIGNVDHAMVSQPHAKAILMQNHGAVCYGKSYEETFSVVRALEEACRKQYHDIAKLTDPLQLDEEYSLMDYMEIYHKEKPDEKAVHQILFDHQGVGCVVEINSPYIYKYSQYGTMMRTYVDDLGQLVGPKVDSVGLDATDQEIEKLIKGESTAVLIQNKGAICMAKNEADATALAMIIDKNCQMGLLRKAGKHPRPVKYWCATREHIAYEKSYSKMKEVNS